MVALQRVFSTCMDMSLSQHNEAAKENRIHRKHPPCTERGDRHGSKRKRGEKLCQRNDVPQQRVCGKRERNRERAEEAAYCLIDWMDSDSFFGHPQYGAEAQYYESLNRPYTPANKPFEVLDEMLLVKGVTPELFEKIKYDPDQFGKEKNEFEFSQDTNPFDYAYCITAHKAQGDEWENVLVIEQQCKNWSHKRWAYTAASRAKKTLKWKVG